MKRIAIGVLWFLALYLGCSLAMAVYVMASLGTTDQALVTTASAEFGAKYGPYTLMTSLLAAIVGTWMGWLPGTRRAPAAPAVTPTASPEQFVDTVIAPTAPAHPFGPKQALVLLLLQLAAQLAAGVLIGVGWSVAIRMGLPLAPAAQDNPQFLAFTILIGGLLQVWFSVLYVRSRAGPRLTSDALDGVAWRTADDSAIWQGFGLGAVLGVAVLAVVVAYPPDESALTGPLITLQRAGGWPFGVLVLFALVIAPLLEEFVFRGAAFGAIHSRWGLWPAAILPNLFFVALHFADKTEYPLGFAMVAALAALTTWLRVRHGSLAPAIAAHFAYNLMAVVAG